MKLLAIDTSSLACAVGVMVDEQIVTRDEHQPREHTRILMPMIRAALADAAVALADLDAVVLGNGPGSFIGMRIGASVAQGLAYGAGIDIVPVSSMATVAMAAGAAGETVAVAQDAHMQEVYLGIYRIDARGLPVEQMPERLQSQVPIPDLDVYKNAIAAGFGWQRYPELLAANRNKISRVSDVYYPSAHELLSLGQNALAAGTKVAPENVNPAYLRQKVAAKPRSAEP